MVDVVTFAGMSPAQRLAALLSRHAVFIILSLVLGFSVSSYVGYKVYKQTQTESGEAQKNFATAIDSLATVRTTIEQTKSEINSDNALGSVEKSKYAEKLGSIAANLNSQIDILRTYQGTISAQGLNIEFSLVGVARADPTSGGSSNDAGISKAFAALIVGAVVVLLYIGSISMILFSKKPATIKLGQDTYKTINGVFVGLIPSVLGFSIHK